MPMLADNLASALQPFIECGELVGAVGLVASEEGLLGVAAVGYADLATGQSMQPDTLFWIASQTKPITATALMMLVDEGTVALDDPVAKYIPEFEDLWVKEPQDDGSLRLTRPRHAVTIREVLSHTAGMAFRSAIEQPTLDALPLALATVGYAMTPLDREPGAAYAYSNAGINTAGRIIEIVSGRVYEEFLVERLLGPLEMTDTTFRPSKQQQSRLAKSYRPNADGSAYEETDIGQLTYPLDDPRRCPMPAGGLFSTAADCAKFLQMVMSGGTVGGRRFLSPDAIAHMTSKQTPAWVPESYGLGWSVGDGQYGHGGAYNTAMTVYPALGRLSVYLVQHAGLIGGGASAREKFEAAATDRAL